jgi:hypothetical protein
MQSSIQKSCLAFFSFIKHFSLCTNIPNTGNSPRLQWVQAVTHVCNYWRFVTLSGPSHPAAVQAFLERSQGLCIVLDTEIISSMLHQPDPKMIVLAHMRRVRKFSIVIPNGFLKDALCTLEADMPHLEFLDIKPAGATNRSPLRVSSGLSFEFSQFKNLEHLRDV